MRYAILYAKNEHRNYQMSLNEKYCETDCLKGNKHISLNFVLLLDLFRLCNLATTLCFSSKLKAM